MWFNQAPVYCGSLSEELGGMQQSEPSTGLDASKVLDCTYGDGGLLPGSVFDEVRRRLREESVSFAWQRGDVLLIDNLRVGHGRTPFKGERKVFAALAVELWRH